MAKTLLASGHAVLPRTNDQNYPATSSLSWLAQATERLFRTQQEKDMERFINERGGVLSDDVERDLAKHLSRV